MIETIILALGLVCVIEGLVLALAPTRLEDLLAALAEIPTETRRLLGLLAITFGVAMIVVGVSFV